MYRVLLTVKCMQCISISVPIFKNLVDSISKVLAHTVKRTKILALRGEVGYVTCVYRVFFTLNII